MAANQKFDFGRAKELQNTLQNEINKIESDLKRMASKVEGVTEWWSGGSEQSFIGNFQTTKTQVVKSLNTWINDYKKLIADIADIKQQSDADLASKLKI